MARQFGAIKTSIWGDDEFTDLTVAAQQLYFYLTTGPTTSLVGVADWRPRKIVPKARDLTADWIETTALELSERRYIILDEDTEEVLVRSFMRHDGCLKQRNMADGIVRAYADVASKALKSHVRHELRRIHSENPEYAGFKDGKLDHILAVNPIGDAIAYPIGDPIRDGMRGTYTHNGTGNLEP
jgi:hypothetical protein